MLDFILVFVFALFVAFLAAELKAAKDQRKFLQEQLNILTRAIDGGKNEQ